MPRKLKTYVTTSGFYHLAVAAHSRSTPIRNFQQDIGVTGSAGRAPAGKVLPAKLCSDIIRRERELSGKEGFPISRDCLLERKLLRDVERITPSPRSGDLDGGEPIRLLAQALQIVSLGTGQAQACRMRRFHYRHLSGDTTLPVSRGSTTPCVWPLEPSKPPRVRVPDIWK